MPSTFWSNTIWFLLLGIATAVELAIILRKSKDWKTTLAFYFTVCGAAFSIEAAICCFMKSYGYYPMIFTGNQLDNFIAGNLFSQFLVSATALLIAVLNLKKRWFFIVAGIYVAIEELFIQLGVFSHNWYQTWMTFFGFLSIFLIVKKLYYSPYEYKSKAMRCIYIFLGLFTLHVPTAKWPFKLTGILTVNMKLLPDEMSSYALIILTNLAVISAVCLVVYFTKLKKWLKPLMVLALYAFLYAEASVGVIHIRDGWFFIFSTVDIFTMILYIYIMDHLYGKEFKRV